MQIGNEICHLFVCEAPREGRHHSLAGENDAAHFSVGGRRSAGERAVREDSVQIGRNFLQLKVVVFVAVRAADRVEMLPFRLLRS